MRVISLILPLLVSQHLAWGQAPADSIPPSPKAENQGVAQGVPLQTGVGYFANPDNFHNLSLGVQAGLGVSEKSETFGYDNLSVSTKWKLGDNAIGQRLSFLAGFSDWRVPAYRKVFPDSVIDPLPKQDRFGAQSANAASFGLLLALGRNQRVASFDEAQRKIIEGRLIEANTANRPGLPLTTKQRQRLLGKGLTTEELARWQQAPPSEADQSRLNQLGLPMSLLDSLKAKKISPDEKLKQRAETAELVKQMYQDAQLKLVKGLAFSTGFLFRLASFSTETDVQAYDGFMTLAKGAKGVDVVAAVHYLRYLDKSLPKSASTVALGTYLNLSDTGPTPVLGLTASYGHYVFNELEVMIPEAAKRTRSPTTGRFDAVLSYSGAPDKDKQTSAGLGIRYSRISPSLLPAYNAFSLVFSSNFSLIK